MRKKKPCKLTSQFKNPLISIQQNEFREKERNMCHQFRAKKKEKKNQNIVTTYIYKPLVKQSR